jgi:hypothetical protein
MDEDNDLTSRTESDRETSRKPNRNDDIAVPSFSYDPEGFLRTAAELMSKEGSMYMTSAENNSESFLATLEPTMHPENSKSGCIIPKRITQSEFTYSRKITPDEEISDKSQQKTPTLASQGEIADTGTDTISQTSLTSSYSNTCLDDLEPQCKIV